MDFKPNAVFIDCETLGKSPYHSVILDFAFVPFNTSTPTPFEELVKNGLHVKFDVEKQLKEYGRKIDPDTLAWWSKQSEKAKEIIKPSPKDVDYKILPNIIDAAFEEWDIDLRKVKLFSRGSSFDIGFLKSIYEEVFGHNQFDAKMPYAYWNERDVRTSIESMLLLDDVRKIPVNSYKLEGFVAHNSIHDCAKDIVLLHSVREYAQGLEFPESDYILV